MTEKTTITDLTEHTLTRENVFDGSLLHIRRDRVRLPDGGEATREFVVHPGAVMIIPVFDNGDVLIERQFRYPMEKIMIEFPAGKLDQGEQVLTAAKRELEEETGYSAAHWTQFHLHHPLIAYSTEFIAFFIARGLTSGAQKLDEGEFLSLERIPAAQLLDLIDRGDITDGKTVTGALLAHRRGLI